MEKARSNLATTKNNKKVEGFGRLWQLVTCKKKYGTEGRCQGNLLYRFASAQRKYIKNNKVEVEGEGLIYQKTCILLEVRWLRP